MRESHLTNFPQAEAKPEPAQAYEHGLGFSFLEGQGREKLSFTDGFQAELSQHNTNNYLSHRGKYLFPSFPGCRQEKAKSGIFLCHLTSFFFPKGYAKKNPGT